MVGVIGSATVNMLATYVIGRRADAYFGLGPDAVSRPAEILRARLPASTSGSWLGWLSDSLQSAGGAVATGARRVGGQAAAEVGDGQRRCSSPTLARRSSAGDG